MEKKRIEGVVLRRRQYADVSLPRGIAAFKKALAAVEVAKVVGVWESSAKMGSTETNILSVTNLMISSDTGVWPFVQSFGSLSAPPEIRRDVVGSVEELQVALITDILGSQHFAAYPPSEQCQRKYWKAIINGIELLGEVSPEKLFTASVAVA